MSAEGFFAGYIGGCAGILVGHPLDTVKVRIQTQAGLRSYKGVLHCVKHLVQSEGFLGLYKGLTPPLVGVSGQNALLFGIHYGILNNLDRNLYNEFLSGCITGALQTVLSSPIDFVKIQLQLQAVGERTATYHKKVQGPFDVLYYFYKKNGFSGCFRGFTITLIRDCPSYGVYFATNYYFCELFKRDKKAEDSLGHVSLLIAGGLAGMASWGFCYPIDVLKTLIQAEGYLPHGKYKSILDCAKVVYIQGGVLAFTRGLSTTLLRAFPVNAVVFYTVSLVSRNLNCDSFT